MDQGISLHLEGIAVIDWMEDLIDLESDAISVLLILSSERILCIHMGIEITHCIMSRKI